MHQSTISNSYQLIKTELDYGSIRQSLRTKPEELSCHRMRTFHRLASSASHNSISIKAQNRILLLTLNQKWKRVWSRS